MVTTRRRGMAVAVCTLATFIVNVDNTAYQVSLTQIRDSLPATFTQGQWILNGYILTLAALEVVAGALGDRFNKRSLLVTGLAIYVTGSILTALSPNAFAMIAARVLAGIGASILVPVGLAMVRVLARDSRELARFTGGWGAVVGLGMATGPLAGGFVSGNLGWRMLPLATAVLATVFAVLAIVFLPSTPPQHCPRHDWNGIVLLGVAMFGLIGLLIAVGEPSDVTQFGLLILVTFLGGYLVIRRQRSGLFPIPEQACRSPRFRAAMYVAISNYFCVGGAIFLLASVFFQARQHLSVIVAGVSLVPLAFGYAIGARISPMIIGRWGVFRAVVAAGLLMLAASSSIAALIAMSSGVTTVSVVAMVLGAGMGMANTPTNVLAMSELPVDYAGTSGAFASVARQLGQAMGIAVCGAAYSLSAAAPGPASLPWIAVVTAAAIITLTGMVFLTRHSSSTVSGGHHHRGIFDSIGRGPVANAGAQ